MKQVLESIAKHIELAKNKLVKNDKAAAAKEMEQGITKLKALISGENDARAKKKMAAILERYEAFRDDIVNNKFAENTEESSVGYDELFSSDLPKVHWDDIVGLGEIKDHLIRDFTYRLKFKDAMKDIPALKSLILYGPPGTGKTMLAAAIATESNSNFCSVSASSILSKWQGESEKSVKALFDYARAHLPSVIFIDEVEGLLSTRSSGDVSNLLLVKNEFLQQLNHMPDGFLFVGATNSPWDIDGAVVRRFQKKVYVPLPSAEDRFILFKKRLPMIESENDIAEFAGLTDGYSASDIEIIANQAMAVPFQRAAKATVFIEERPGFFRPSSSDQGIPMRLADVPAERLLLDPVCANDVMETIDKIKASVDEKLFIQYEKWGAAFGK